MRTNTIGVIGQGFVGGSLREGFEEITDIVVETYDIAKPEVSTCETNTELFEKTDVIFVCVPTPMKQSGKCDTRIVEGVLDEIHKYSVSNNAKKIAVVKSTIPPGSTAMWNDKFGRSKLRVVFNPEFLTEANAKQDFLNQNRIILGGPPEAVDYVQTVFSKFTSKQRWGIGGCTIARTTSTTAEFIKYVTNCYLAMKVSFSNEIFDMANALGVDYDELMDTTTLDSRISRRHTQVPGPDGNQGFGGHCFPKDLRALIYVAKNIGVDPMILQAVWDKNEAVRPASARDWEQMKGRAVSED
jgi:UDPglucose 6-dehydrogenase